MTRRRGATEEPVDDYHDTGIPVTNARTRPRADACRLSAGTGDPTVTKNMKGKNMIASSAITPPEGFEPVAVPRLRTILATELQGSLHVVDRAPRDLWVGPRHLLPIGVTLEELWLPDLGRILRRADTAEILPPAAIRAALAAIVEAWTEVCRHDRREEAPSGWTPSPRRDGLPATEWRGSVFAAPGGAIPDLQVRWTAASGAFLARTDNGGALTRADVQGTLAGLRAALDALD